MALYLVTGIGGFIGSSLAYALLEDMQALLSNPIAGPANRQVVGDGQTGLVVRPVAGEPRPMLEMDSESITADAGIEVFILKIELEAKLITVICNRPVKIIDEKLRDYASKVRSTVNCLCGHV